MTEQKAGRKDLNNGQTLYFLSYDDIPGRKNHGKLYGNTGRVTTDDNFTFYEKPELDENIPLAEAGDYVAEKADMYYVSDDPSGRLGWKSADLTYIDTTAHVIEVLTEKAGNGEAKAAVWH